MEKKSRGIILLLTTAVIGAALAAIFTHYVGFQGGEIISVGKQIGGTIPETRTSDLFNPPKPEDAPEAIKEAVVYGYNIIKDTQNYAPQLVGNKLNCTNCHFDAGREKDSISLVGVSAVYPKFRERQHYAVDLLTRTKDCFERSMNGTSPAPDSKEMTALLTYYHWISRGITIYSDVPWLGLKHLKSDHSADPNAGKEVYSLKCQQCHGNEGQGSQIAPPLWGDGSFNDGAGMNKFENFAAFTHHFMPRGAPDLSIDQALDVTKFALGNPRPHFQKKSEQ